jgi:hypothetical protein
LSDLRRVLSCSRTFLNIQLLERGTVFCNGIQLGIDSDPSTLPFGLVVYELREGFEIQFAAVMD